MFNMNDRISVLLSVGIPAVISIIGFLLTIFTLKKEFQNELVKQKANVQLEKMSTMPYEILELMQNMIDSGKNPSRALQEKLKAKMDRVFSTIYAYGTATSIHILAAMQSENYQNISASQEVNRYRMMAFYVLLTVQIRTDITGEVVSPEEWFKMKITDFQDNRDLFRATNNELVNELNLNRQYLMQ